MKRLYGIILLLIISAVIPETSFSQNIYNTGKTEYIVLWVSHNIIRDRVDTRLQVDIGTMKEHPLYGIVENGEGGTVIFKNNDKRIVIKNEVDFLMLVSDFGFQVYTVNPFEITGKQYFKYVLLRKTGN